MDLYFKILFAITALLAVTGDISPENFVLFFGTVYGLLHMNGFLSGAPIF
ncbi:hypothetical protein HY572_06990 [Candidatus Micrarchaeota archaeon]|nr:hypothetical protein [Candidatus Micrarchaeota archaeon]